MAKVTIYDVSERAGVGIATVSRVLNSPDNVADETRERVLAVIDDLGFVPKFEARTRARKQLGRIGVLTPILTSASFVDLLNGVRTALTGQPYELVIYDAATVAQRDAVLTNSAMTQTVDGLITLFYPLDDTAVRRLKKYQLPLVQLTHSDDPHINTFTSIGVESIPTLGRMAADHLLARGHRRLAFVGDKDVPEFLVDTSSMKLDGFRQRLAEAGVSLPDAYVGRAPYGIEQAREQARRILDLPQPPTAIFAASDTQAIGALSAARERGMAVPADLALMGCDDIEVAEFIGLTTISLRLQERGQIAVELLLAQIAEGTASPKRIDVPVSIVQRETA
ncbi:MAG TPA: LacI family DNA-binding transcriptional regulator [Anaerolineales bacterium]|nr:LacI family DNA-binding transcriptional regulator [Anaerolineales bacterium]